MIEVLATDPRPAWCESRRREQDRLVDLRARRAAICGCDKCGDANQGYALDALIARTIARITQAGNLICERP